MEWLAPHLSRWGYPFIFLMTFLETSAFISLFVPGETTVVVAGFLAAREMFKLKYVILCGFVGAFLGDFASYLLGRYGVAKLTSRLGKLIFTRGKEIEKARWYFLKHGGKAILLGRFTSLLRAFTPFAAGMSRMRFPKFLFYDILGAACWSSFFSSVGFFLEEGWERVERWLGATGIGVILLVVFIILFYQLWRRKVA